MLGEDDLFNAVGGRVGKRLTDSDRLDWLIEQTRGRANTATFVRNENGEPLYVIVWLHGAGFDRAAIDRGIEQTRCVARTNHPSDGEGGER